MASPSRICQLNRVPRSPESPFSWISRIRWEAGSIIQIENSSQHSTVFTGEMVPLNVILQPVRSKKCPNLKRKIINDEGVITSHTSYYYYLIIILTLSHTNVSCILILSFMGKSTVKITQKSEFFSSETTTFIQDQTTSRCDRSLLHYIQ